MGDDPPVELFDEVRVQILLLGPFPASDEHGPLPFGGADAFAVRLEAGRGRDVSGPAAEEAQDFAVQAVYRLADVYDVRAIFGRLHETSPRTLMLSLPAVSTVSVSALRER